MHSKVRGRRLIPWRKHHNIFPGALAKLKHILMSQFQVSAVGDPLVVQNGAISTLQVDDVGLDFPNFVSKLVPLLDVAKLYDSMLLAYARVLSRQVHDSHVLPNKPATAQTEVNRVDEVLALEHEKFPEISR